MAISNTLSGCDGPTERISSFVDTLLQPISKIQKSYLKDTTDLINFIENTKVKKRTFLVSMDVTSLYTNIPQNEGIEIVCKAYENFYKDNPPIPTHQGRIQGGWIGWISTPHFSVKKKFEMSLYLK